MGALEITTVLSEVKVYSKYAMELKQKKQTCGIKSELRLVLDKINNLCLFLKASHLLPKVAKALKMEYKVEDLDNFMRFSLQSQFYVGETKDAFDIILLNRYVEENTSEGKQKAEYILRKIANFMV